MQQCLSEFLNLLDLRSQCWCLVDLGEDGGLRSPAGDAIYFYAMIEGTGFLSGVPGGPLTMKAGDVAIILSGQAHAIRVRPDGAAAPVAFLTEGRQADIPPSFTIGDGAWSARLLCGKLAGHWPGGLNPEILPATLSIGPHRSVVNMEALLGGLNEPGSASVLARAAALLLTSALRDHPDSKMLFRDAHVRNPIGHAIHHMEAHPLQEWTVASLAAKVGMGRSTFAARFLNEAGRSPMEVLTEIRMRLAATLLTQTRLKVAEVGERVGYRSESAFSRRFVAYFNTTPGQMRHEGSVPPENRLQN